MGHDLLSAGLNGAVDRRCARLVDELISFARAAGYRKITLWTHSVLTAARHIYQKAGFKLMRSEKHQSWGQPVVSEHWDLEL